MGQASKHGDVETRGTSAAQGHAAGQGVKMSTFTAAPSQRVHVKPSITCEYCTYICAHML